MTAQTEINKLRLHSSEKQALAAKMWLAAALNNADLRPAGVSPTAVLIVRHLSDPKPGRLVLDGTSLRPDAAWETAVRHALTVCYQQAARPERGTIPASAAAVLFADESELLACLALDLARGEAQQRWWWQVPLRSLPPDGLTALTTSWCEKAIHIPAAVAHLTTWQQADRVLNRLATRQVETLLNALATAYELPALLPAKKSILVGDFEGEGANGRSSSPLPDLQHTKTTAVSWQTLWGGQRPPLGLTTEQLFLWGWAVSLYHNPSAARQPAFQEVAQRWLSSQQRSNMKMEKPEAAVPVSASVPSEVSLAEAAEMRRRETAVSPPHSPEPEVPPDLSASSASPSLAPALSPLPSSAPEWEDAAEAKTAVSPPPPSLSPSPTTAPPLSPAAHATPPFGWVDGQITRLAGVFYLINMMQRLGLPACFDGSWALGQQLSPWAVLELLARGLLLDADETVAADPLWLALAELDAGAEQRRSSRLPGTLPGADFQGIDRYELPAAWFSELNLDPAWLWASKNGAEHGRNGRYWRVWSESGCLICQQPTTAGQDTLAEITNWLKAARLPLRPVLSHGRFADAPIDITNNPLLAGLAPDLTQWLAFVLPAIRLWLHEKLAERDPNSSLILQPSAFQKNGRLYLSSSHVDIVMPLNSISLPVRLAGLDLDPGWLPDYGRVIQFHYEA